MASHRRQFKPPRLLKPGRDTNSTDDHGDDNVDDIATQQEAESMVRELDKQGEFLDDLVWESPVTTRRPVIISNSLSNENTQPAQSKGNNSGRTFLITASQLLAKSKSSTSTETGCLAVATHPKKRKIHMTDKDCLDYAQSTAGSSALTNPMAVKKSSMDPNRGLYPPLPSLKPMNSFKSASSVLNPDLSSFITEDPLPQKRPFFNRSTSDSPPKNKRSKLPSQSNKLDNYFAKESKNSESQSSQTFSSTPPSSQGTPTKMYSPIKAISPGGRIFVCDTSPSSSRGSASSEPPHKLDITKKLFSSQNSTKSKSSKASNKSKKTPTFNRSNPFLYSGPAKSSAPSNVKSEEGDKYGLLGMGGCPKEEALCYMDFLPQEVLENILCRLPMMDLCLNLSIVCKRWNDVIAYENFIPWKKKYYKLKIEDMTTKREMVKILKENKIDSIANYLTGLIKYMKGFRSRPEVYLNTLLQKHRKYGWATALLQERLPDCITEKIPDPWCVVATLVVISDCVRDISEIFTVLLEGNSCCTVTDVIECLYCLATFLLTFRQLKYEECWTGIHYRVFYALYLYENESSATASELQDVFKNTIGQQSIMKYSNQKSSVRMTHEQLRICSHDVNQGEVIKIIAFAGTGKTTTLVKYTQLRPHKKFLLVVFNKAICEHALTQFPPNVVCKTGHKMAYAAVGRMYGIPDVNGITKIKKDLKVGMIADVISAKKGESLYVQAKFVLETIKTFCASKDEFITTAHVPTTKLDKNNLEKVIDHDMRMHISEQAERVWNMMKDYNHRKIGMTHDGYLKMWQLKKPTLYGYDCILIDEAQDLTPAVEDILMRQSQPKILVGDPHQQIYAFRGAVNAMANVEASQVFYLTQSFRFGPEIAHVASVCLEMLKGEKKKTLVGNGIPGSIQGDTEGQIAIICRSNFTVFSEAVNKCCYSETNLRVAFAGGTNNFGFDTIQDIYTLMLPVEERAKRPPMKNALVKKFYNLGDLEKFAEKTSDMELLGKLRIVKTYNHMLPNLIPKILSKCIDNMNTADIVFTTAHKAKGLEFSSVCVTDDFNISHQQGLGQVPEDEANLAYVAVTRAKKRLILSPSVRQLMKRSGETFFYPQSSSDMKKDGVPFQCIATDRTFEPTALTLHRKEMKLYNCKVESAGSICPQFILEDKYSLGALYGSLVDERVDVGSINIINQSGNAQARLIERYRRDRLNGFRPERERRVHMPRNYDGWPREMFPYVVRMFPEVYGYDNPYAYPGGG